MNAKHPHSWFGSVVLVGAIYATAGIVFALPAGHARAWRMAAWIVSAVVYASHLGYERFRLRNSSLISALHVALAAALGALGLAIAANLHSLSVTTTSQHQRLLLIALAAWPAITGLPAFLVALGLSAALTRLFRRKPATLHPIL